MSDGRLLGELQPGDVIDVPHQLVVGTDNEAMNEFEYAVVECVGGGWADHLAGPGEVVVYTENFAVPIIGPADLTVEVVEI
jgi:hypothetical protein